MQAQCSYDAQIVIGPTCPPFGDPSILGLNSVNADTVAVGSFDQCYPEDVFYEGFLWTLESGMTVLERPDWVISLAAQDVNDHGQVALNMAIECEGCADLAFLYERGIFTPLPVLPGAYPYSVATSLNSHGAVAGWSGSPWVHAVLWQDGRIIDIGGLLPVLQSRASDVNDQHVVVGWTEPPTIQFDAFIYNHGRVQLLGPIPGGVSSRANAVNNFNVIVGRGHVPGPAPSGFVSHAFRWMDGRMIDLGVLPGDISSNAADVNDVGVIVGGGDGPRDERAYIWYGDTPIDLNTLVVTGRDLVIEGATGINESGQITAIGQLLYEGYWTIVGVLLTPKPASPADFTGDCHVNSKDLGILLASWGPLASARRNENPAADLDANGIVNGFDLAILLAAWG